MNDATFSISAGDAVFEQGSDGFFVAANYAPASFAHEQMEAQIASAFLGTRALSIADVPSHIMHGFTADSAPESLVTVDPIILSLMRLAEYYLVTEGDIRQALQATVDVGIKGLRVQHKDSGVRKAYEEIVNALNLVEIARSAWFTAAVYGAAWPIEFWDGKKGDSLKGAVPSVTLLNPKHVAPARGLQVGGRAYYYAPSEDTFEDIVRGDAAQAFYNSLGSDWNEPVQLARGIKLDPRFVYRIADEWFMHSIFPVPMIAGAQRQLSTRQILEEMIRSTIEGVKTQLWVFSLKEPRKNEVAALRSLLEGQRGARTGYLIWSDNLEVKQYIPQAIDELLSNETWQRMTHAVFRSLGLFMRVASGETPTVGGGQRGDAELDVTIWTDRMNAPRQRVQSWLDRFSQHIAESLGVSEPAYLKLNQVGLSIRGEIRDRLQPLLNFGFPSVRTGMEMAGLDPDMEIENMRQEQEDGTRALIFPYTGFAQVANNSKRVESVMSPGRPAGMPPTPADLNKTEASLESYRVDVDEAFGRLLSGAMTVQAFIESLREINRRNREEAYLDGYKTHGGIGEPAEERLVMVQLWDAPNLEKFGSDLEATEERSGFRFRASMYATEGWKQAYMAGMWQAKREQGWKAWRRIPRPNACAECMADARVIHPIEDEWFELHPNGECGYSHVQFYAGTRVSAPTKVPYYIQGE